MYSQRLSAGCATNSPLAFKSVIYLNQQNVSTEGHLESTPKIGSSRVDAPLAATDAFKPNTNFDTKVATGAAKNAP